jgi:hypothetical protein
VSPYGGQIPKEAYNFPTGATMLAVEIGDRTNLELISRTDIDIRNEAAQSRAVLAAPDRIPSSRLTKDIMRSRTFYEVNLFPAGWHL